SVLLNGKISDSGLTVTSNIYGNLKIKFVGNDALEIRGEMSNIVVDIDEIDCNGNNINIEKGSKLNITINRFIGLEFNYVFSLSHSCEVYDEIKEKIETPPMTSDTIGCNIIRLQNNFQGTFVITCPYVFIGDSVHGESGVFLRETNRTGSSGFV